MYDLAIFIYDPVLTFFFFLINLFISGCVGSSFLCEGFLQLRRVGATLHRGVRASHYRGLSLRSTGSRRAGSVVVAHGLSCSAACGILPDQGSNPCPLHRQADSQPLRHQGSPVLTFIKAFFFTYWINCIFLLLYSVNVVNYTFICFLNVKPILNPGINFTCYCSTIVFIYC